MSILQSAAQSSLAEHAPSSNEAAVTGRLAVDLATHHNKRSIWVADRHHSALPTGAVAHTSYAATMKSYDLAAAAVVGATAPEMLVQVKWRHTGTEVQGVHLFLGDVVLAALDAHLMAAGDTSVDAYGVAVMPRAEYDNSTYWKPFIEAMTGDARLLLEPSLAANTTLHAKAPADQWLDTTAREIRPNTRPQFNRLFSASTSGKYLGLFNRPGRLVVSLKVEQFAGTQKCGFVFHVDGLELEGVAVGTTISNWWP